MTRDARLPSQSLAFVASCKAKVRLSKLHQRREQTEGTSSFPGSSCIRRWHSPP